MTAADQDAPARGAIEAAGRGQLRFLTCGSVDDGKSTLIGRLLVDSRRVFDDQLAALERDSRRFGTTGEDVDYALLLDGLEAEREQGITIDVAWRFFATARRSFVVMDAPGHEQYTRNMATAASTAELAVLLVDARKGLLDQTRRHAAICALFRVRHVVLAVNKIDLAGFSQETFDAIVADFAAFVQPFGFASLTAVPVSARFGDNVVAASPRTPWYGGPALLDLLETIDVESDPAAAPFRLPVQWVARPNAEFRGFAGTVASGRVAVGDAVVVQPSGAGSTVARIVTADGDRDAAAAGDAVTLVLADERDVSRGDLLAAADAPAEVGDQIQAHLLWMGEQPLLPGRACLMRIGTRWVGATVSQIRHRIDVRTLAPLAARRLVLNEIAVCNLSVAAPIAFDSYAADRTTGAFVLVDRETNDTVAAGMIDFGLRRAANLRWERLAVDKAARARLKGQRPCVVWFTGLSGAGKSTIARLVEQRLHAEGLHTYMLDGDNVRHGLNRDLGFTDADRVENIRRVGEVAKLMVDAGLIVLCALISPFRAERQAVRELLGAGEFVEVFVDAPLDLCMARDPKGLYAKARAGRLTNFTGIDSPYERPDAPDLVLDTAAESAEALAEQVVARVRGG
ncbi:sulfate adenylyltransferase subunit CysN [Rhodoplanes sp. TEM]|uniref:Multifunctional fusion protein n=1 Tax=Rhodoplanes tepidamans TaxID=200616 RepID=A0ABT5JD31_RHOTP|nr:MULTISPECIES: sulfate adenylyltransferase subunit CysN [Rhodoplanes]MDC7787418.1 sulfate adenylyltransferase subunit CysN [Rhodoplanes tepidamans]MDC7985537.1 sulfate adenylyltransferase subunit CysN [Rhodoplanes sp. TEM]MDQ0358096.1 bifunctional enzyme CysN/CysC [Rhodoplanes tepidamans]